MGGDGEGVVAGGVGDVLVVGVGAAAEVVVLIGGGDAVAVGLGEEAAAGVFALDGVGGPPTSAK